MKRYVPLENVCRNPRCGEPLGALVLVKLCPSCRLAFRFGAVFMAVLGAVCELVRRWLS